MKYSLNSKINTMTGQPARRVQPWHQLRQQDKDKIQHYEVQFEQ